MEFLSTPSARRATQCGQLRHQLLQDFYPRPPRGGRRLAKIIGHALNAISIHALREEGDGLLYDYYTLADLFLSTPSARRATVTLCYFVLTLGISIHALREEGDAGILEGLHAGSNFYPRPPRGGRHDTAFSSPPFSNFYPRPPRGGRRRSAGLRIYTHRFLSTPSARRATCQPRPGSRPDQFLSTPSARRATRMGAV